MRNRTESSAMNIAFGTMNQVVSMLLNFISRTIFIYVLGAEYLGINGLFSDILMMLSLAEMGLRTSMAYTFYEPIAQNDSVKVALLTQFYKKIYHTIAFFVSIVGISLVPFLDYLVNLENTLPYVKIYYLFFLADIVASYFFVYKTSVIEADQKKYIITKYQMMVNIAKIVLQIGILLLTHNYFLYLTLQIISTLLNNFFISRKATQLYPMIRDHQGVLDKSERKNIFTNMKSMFVFKLSTTIIKGTDNIMMSVLFGTIWVGLYSNYLLVIMSLENFTSVIYMSVTASIGNVVATEKPSKRYEIFQLTQIISLMLTSFATICMYLLLQNFIYVWLGDEYTISTLFYGAIILNFYLKMVTYPVFSFRQATGLYIQTRYIMLLAAILNIIFSFVMARLMGISGILYASALSQLITYFWLEPKLLFKQYFNQRTRRYFLSILTNGVGTAIIIFILSWVLNGFFIESWMTFFLKTFIVGISAMGYVLATYWRTKEFKQLLAKLSTLLKNKKSKKNDLRASL